MKKIYLFLIAMVMVSAVIAKENIVVNPTSTAPEIDAVIDDMWDNFTETAVEKIYTGTTPSNSATFKLAWDNDNLYMLVVVEDDDHYPGWEAANTAVWEFDKLEVYFDVNDVLNDAKGPSAANTGHYQYAPDIVEAGYGVPTVNALDANCYELDGEGYIMEMSWNWGRFSNAEGVAMDIAKIQALPEKLGFDLCVMDNDEAAPGRQRIVWQNDGTGAGEAWGNMDDCGTIEIAGKVGVNNIAAATMNVYPNPVIDQLTIGAKFNKVVISNLVGQQVKTIETSSKTINVSDLSKGVYVVKAFNNGKQVGTAKITKN